MNELESIYKESAEKLVELKEISETLERFDYTLSQWAIDSVVLQKVGVALGMGDGPHRREDIHKKAAQMRVKIEKYENK